MKGRYFYVPKQVATSPKSGECLVEQYWAVHPEKGLVFYHHPFNSRGVSPHPFPMCNKDEDLARRVLRKMLPDCEVQYIQVVYMQHAIKAARKDAEEDTQ